MTTLHISLLHPFNAQQRRSTLAAARKHEAAAKLDLRCGRTEAARRELEKAAWYRKLLVVRSVALTSESVDWAMA